MKIVLNEIEWVENALEQRQLGDNPFETLSRLARYYYQHLGYKKREIYSKISAFLLQCDPNVVLTKWDHTIETVVKNADKYQLITVSRVPIFCHEMDVIREISSRQEQRLAFALLCACKYWDAVDPKRDHWVNTDDNEIFKMGNVRTSTKIKSSLLKDMHTRGLLQFSSRVDNLSVRVMYADEDGAVATWIDDFRNLGNQWHMLNGERFIRCEQCGLCVHLRGISRKRSSPTCDAGSLHTRIIANELYRNQ